MTATICLSQFCPGSILATALVDILETTASKDNGDDDKRGEEDDDYVFYSDDE